MDSGIRFDSGSSTKTPHKMKKIRRNWTKMAISPRIAHMRQAVDKQKATPSPIPHPYPDLASLDAKVAAAEEEDDIIAGLESQLKIHRALRNTKTDAAAEEFEHNAKHVESDTKGEPAPMIAAGFAVSDPAAAIGPMTKPLDLAVTMSETPGSNDWHCHPVEGAGSMEVETTATPNDPASWKSHLPVTQSRGTITGLPSGVRTYFRVRAIGPLGPGPWSDEVSKMVP